MLRSVRQVFVVAALASAAGTAIAAELGRLTVHSRLGEPLDASIEVLDIRPGEERRLDARLASRAAFRLAGVPYSQALDTVRTTLEREGERTRLRLTSSQPLEQPTLPLMLELYSGRERQVSHYTLRLDADAAAAAPGAAEGRQAGQAEGGATQWRGFVQNEIAYAYRDPSHWSRGVVRTQLGAHGGDGGLKWRATLRLDVDPVYAASDFYPPAVRRDQRRDLFVRETYLDTRAGGLEWRIGKQHIIWGEMVGLFFADVVSARDQRDFILPEFDILRIPQWAVRAERFGEESHAEVIWLPWPEVDRIGEPGAEFYPLRFALPAGFSQRIEGVQRPARTLRNSNLGLRASTLRGGWDLSAFYYRSTDVNPTFYREVALGPAPTLVFTPRHDRIWQLGGTLGKDLGPTVLKAEVIYASGRKFNVTRLAEAEGVVQQDTLDYVVGLDFTLPRDTRLNLQYFERVFSGHDPDLLFERREPGFTLLVSGKLGAALTPELLLIHSLNGSDRLVRAKLGWVPERNWRITFGMDLFSGPPSGLFGRFGNSDRVYVDTRRDF